MWGIMSWGYLEEEHLGRGNGRCKGLKAGTWWVRSRKRRETNVVDAEGPSSRVVEDKIIKVSGSPGCYSEPEGKLFLSRIGSMIWWTFQGFLWLPFEQTVMNGGRDLFPLAQSRWEWLRQDGKNRWSTYPAGRMLRTMYRLSIPERTQTLLPTACLFWNH